MRLSRPIFAFGHYVRVPFHTLALLVELGLMLQEYLPARISASNLSGWTLMVSLSIVNRKALETCLAGIKAH